VSVEILAGSVITHRRARIGMAGSDLDVSQVGRLHTEHQQ